MADYEALKAKYAALKERKNKSVELLRALRHEMDLVQQQGVLGFDWKSVSKPLESALADAPCLVSDSDAAALREVDELQRIPADLSWKSADALVKAAGEISIRIQVPKETSAGEKFQLSFVFEVEQNDIEFSIYQENGADEEPDFLVRQSRCQQQSGKVSLPTTGDIVVLWDNSYSWINPKNITYEVKMTRIASSVHFPTKVLEHLQHRSTTKQTMQQQLSALSEDFSRQQARLEALKKTVDDGVKQLQAGEKAVAEMRARAAELTKSIGSLDAAIASLCIRGLNGKLLDAVLQYRCEEDCHELVCQQWSRAVLLDRHAVKRSDVESS